MANFLAPVPDGQMLLANEPASDNAPPSVRPSSLIQRELYRDSLHKQQTGGTRIPPLPGPPAGVAVIADVLDAPADEAVITRTRNGVAALTRKFPVYRA